MLRFFNPAHPLRSCVHPWIGAAAPLQALGEPNAAPLVTALCARPVTFRRAMAACATLDPPRAAPIVAAMDIFDPSADAPPARMSADAASPDLRAAIPMILAVARRSPWGAARDAGALWNALDDEQRDLLAGRAARDASAAADRIARIGPDGLDLLAPAARRRAPDGGRRRAPGR